MKKLALILIVVGILVAGGAVAAVGYFELLDDDNNGDEKANKPVAVIDYTPQEPKVGEEVSFTANNSNDPDGSNEKLSYLWDIDGTSYDTAWTEHVFDSEGEYTVELTVTDEQGLSDTAEELVTVSSSSEVIYEDTRSGTVGGLGGSQEEEEAFTVEERANQIELWWNLSDNSLDGNSAEVTIIVYDGNDTEQYNSTHGGGEFYESFDGEQLEYKGNWRWVIRQEASGMDYDLDIKIWG